MARTRRWGAFAAVLLGFLFTAPSLGAVLERVPVESGTPLQHAGLVALEKRLRASNGLYVETPDGTSFFARDQMMGVLAALQGAKVRPDQADAWNGRARQLWEGSEAGYRAQAASYAKTIPPPDPSVCVDVETNAWALAAASSLAAAKVAATPDPAKRAETLRGVLASFLTSGTSNGERPCPPGSTGVTPNQMPIVLWALLATRASGATSADAAIRSSITNLLRTNYDDAFRLSDNVYLASMNAQMLAVLTEAGRLFGDASFLAARDRVADWLQNVSVRATDGLLVASNMERQGGEFRPLGDNPDGLVWTAYALSNLRALNQSRVRSDIVPGLTAAYIQRYASPAPGGFAGSGSLVYFDFNALPAILTRSPPVSVTSVDPAVLAVIVPAEPQFTYPASGGTPSYVISNQWTVRFALQSDGGATDVLIPANDLAPVDLAHIDAAFPAPRLSRTVAGARTDVPLRAAPDPNLLWFNSNLAAGANPFRLDAFAPVRPVTSDFGANIQVIVHNDAGTSVLLGALQIELDATQLQVRAASVNQATFTAFEVVDPVITEQLQQPHMRVILRDVPLPADSDTEILLMYNDVVRPTIDNVRLARDALGNEPFPRAPSGKPIEVLQGESAYVLAHVADNGALRNVQLRLQLADHNLDLRMSSVPGRPDTYAVKLPTQEKTGRGIVQVVAIDAASTGNLNQSAPLDVEIKNPLLSGSIVMFVFSGTLFVTSFIIWVKVRRKLAR